MVKQGDGEAASAGGGSLVMASGAAVNRLEIRVEIFGQEADKVLRTEVASNGEILFLGKEVVIDDSHVYEFMERLSAAAASYQIEELAAS